ncbi:pyridoxal-5'-phosphate-dependent protein subunit beta [Planctomycetaceae bacterium SCGC AG-212-F19]|nr:pyridoxal-5'-phosphate-dependent protein subunit beta [Planctomycetaceae bacterium SCGC AG-212-F19]
MLTLDLICQAQHRLRGRVHRTQLIPSAALSAYLGAPTYLKLECLQKTGSFKPRGAFNKMLSLSPEQRQRGVVAVSGGNHAQGVAYAAKQLGIAAVIAMPASTPPNYLDATRGYDAEIVLTPDIHAAFAEAARLKDEGRVMIHPFDDLLVAAGQGTIGLEILEDLPGVTRVYVSIGGGALITGVATALRSIKPAVKVIGVETEGADAMARSLAANQLIELPAITSIARTLGAPRVSEFTLHHVQKWVEEVVVVDDAATVAALILILERTKYLTEPAAACCLAAAVRQRSQLVAADQVVLLLCGGNVAAADLSAYQQRFMGKP